MSDMMTFLKLFDDPCPTYAASRQMYGTGDEVFHKDPRIAVMAFEAFGKGWLRTFPDAPVPAPEEKTAKGIQKVFLTELLLTEAGREHCGLKKKPEPEVEPTPKKGKKPKMASASLFDL